MLTLLLYFLTILISHNHLQTNTLIEAKTAPSDGFTIDLVHRYSPNSPFYDSSTSLAERHHQLVLASGSRYHHIKWLYDNKVVDTTVMPNEGDYLMKVSVGTPPVELTAVASTGSDLTWFQCQPCHSCYQRKTTTIFNPAFSNTYKTIPCDSTHCLDLDTRHLKCNEDHNECRYWYAYGNGSTFTMGVMGRDTFTFTSSDNKGDWAWASFTSPAFGCGYDQHGLFDRDATGLVGLGAGPLSLVSQLGPSIGYKFSYCLTPSNSHYTSKLIFGTHVRTEQGDFTQTPYMTKDPKGFYNLNLTGISIGKRSLQVERDIVIDIGTTLTYLNPTIFSSLTDMVNKVIGMKPMLQPPKQLLCYDNRLRRTLTLPDIVFRFSGGDLTLKAKNVFVEFDDGVLCLSIAKSEQDGDPMVLGNMAQVNLEVEFDLLNNMVTFAQKDCAYKDGLE